MTLYYNPWRLRQKSRKLRRFWRRHLDNAKRVRVNFAYGQQWKRYPHCNAIVQLQTGQMTSTWIIPERSYASYRDELIGKGVL